MAEIVIAQDDQGRTFEADRGDLIVIRLEENPTTGYEWEMPVLEFLDSGFSSEPGKLMGRGGTRTLRFRARSSGSQQIRLRLRRSWEPVDVAAQHFEVNIQVRDG